MRRWVLLPVIALAPAARAQPATRPASRPATVPATQPLDLSSPRAALRALAAGLHAGDGGRLEQVVATTNPSERRVVTAMADLAAAFRSLHGSATRAFGAAGATPFGGDTDEQFAQTLARIESAEVTVEGDRATVRYPTAPDVEYELKRSDGRWQVPAVQFAKGADAATLDRRMAETAVQTGVLLELSAEIDAGKYKNADSAYQAWQAKVLQAIGGKNPATRPTTKKHD